MDQAKHSELIGLASRDQFEHHLQQVLRSADINDREHALIYLELEQYDTITKNYGQVAGEELIRQISKVLLQHIRKRDTLSLLDRAAFGVVMEACALSQASRVAGNLARAVSEHRFTWQGVITETRFNIGLVPMTNSHGHLSSVLDAAVSACHEAKNQGSNTVHVLKLDEDLAGQHQAMQWLSYVQQALENDRLALAYQKIIDVSQAEPRPAFGCELLLRMKDEQGNEIAPSSYLPAVEHYNLSAQLDRWVVASTLEWLHRQIQQSNWISLCAINLSAASLDDEAFLDFLLRRFDSSKNLPRKICFEIKEEVALSRIGSVNLFIRTLKDRGCRFLLDEFGTGWSSFSYLKNMPVDFVKINRTLLNGIATDQVDYTIVRSIVDVGHAMGKKVVAAGIESEEVLTRLAALGIDYAQGHYIGSPQPLADFDHRF